MICWHFDHAFKRSVKRANFLSAMVSVGCANLPCAVEFVRKNEWVTDEKMGKQKRSSSKTKNELIEEVVSQCHKTLLFTMLWQTVGTVRQKT